MRSGNMNANAGGAMPPHPTPWTGKGEGHPIGDTGDEDVPFVIRDAAGEVVLTLWEEYGPGMTALHEIIGQRIIAAVNSTPNR